MGDASDAERALAERRMREINEAWRVLGDPAARRAYDESRLGRRRHTSANRPGPVGTTVVHTDDDLVDVLPPMTGLTAGLMRHLPWVAILVVFGVIFVATAYATTKHDPASAVHPPVAAGSCVDVEPGPVAKEVSCDGTYDYRIVERVGSASGCTPPAQARRFDHDGNWDCVEPGDGPGAD